MLVLMVHGIPLSNDHPKDNRRDAEHAELSAISASLCASAPLRLCGERCHGLREQQLEAGAAVTSLPTYAAGAESNFASQPREQKYQVSPANCEEPTAFSESMLMPQTGSMTFIGESPFTNADAATGVPLQFTI